jgi:hypothetical protein
MLFFSGDVEERVVSQSVDLGGEKERKRGKGESTQCQYTYALGMFSQLVSSFVVVVVWYLELYCVKMADYLYIYRIR